MGLPEGGATSAPSAKGTPNGGTSASNDLALPAAVSALLVASNIEMGNHHMYFALIDSFPILLSSDSKFHLIIIHVIAKRETVRFKLNLYLSHFTCVT